MQKKGKEKRKDVCEGLHGYKKNMRDVMSLWFNVDNWTALITKQEKNT